MNKSQKQIMEVVDLLKESDVPYDLTLVYIDNDSSDGLEEEDLNEQPESKLKEIFNKIIPNYRLEIEIGDGYSLPVFFIEKYRTRNNEIQINSLKSILMDDYQDRVKIIRPRELQILQSFRTKYEEPITNLKRKTRLDDIFNNPNPKPLT